MSPGSHPDERPQRRREYSGPWSTLGLAALIVSVVGLATWWFEFRGQGEPGPADGAGGIVELPPGTNPTGRSPAAEPGRAAPDFALRSPDGTLVRLSDHRGDLVVLNFWASWCGPCRAEAPDLNDLARDIPGLAVLGVNQQESLEAVEHFIDEFAIGYPVVLDANGEVSVAYRVGRGLPVTFLVSPDGVIERVIPGQLRAADLDEIRASAAR